MLLGGILSCSDGPGTNNVVGGTAFPRELNLRVQPQNIAFNPTDGVQDSLIQVNLELRSADDLNELNFEYLISRLSNDEVLATGFFEGNSSVQTATPSITLNTGQSETLQIFSFTTQASVQIQSRIPVTTNVGTPPEILNVAFPDTVVKPNSGTTVIVFEAEVTDNDGLETIDRVEMSIFDQSGNPVTTTPLLLFDDGGTADLGNGVTSGDQTAEDGIFTVTLEISSSNTARTLELRFTAFDQSGFSSETISAPFTISDQ